MRALDPPPAETRFKAWFDLVGSAIENAACEHARRDPDATEISFREIFLESEADAEQTDGLATVLSTLREKWPKGFKASDVSSFIKGVDISGDFDDDQSRPREN